MLVLSRKQNEKIIIDSEIIVEILKIKGDKVRLGIDCPTNIPIHRQEVYDAIQKENTRQEEPRKFKNCLMTGNYLEAYQVFLDNSNLPNRRELFELTKGLGDMLKYSEKILMPVKDKLTSVKPKTITELIEGDLLFVQVPTLAGDMDFSEKRVYSGKLNKKLEFIARDKSQNKSYVINCHRVNEEDISIDKKGVLFYKTLEQGVYICRKIDINKAEPEFKKRWEMLIEAGQI